MCPACGNANCQVIQTHSVRAAATHLIPPRRSATRNAELQAALRQLWGGESVRICRCDACGFGFADPFRAGTPDIYTLISGGDESYPQDRFEFSRTLRAVSPGSHRLLGLAMNKYAHMAIRHRSVAPCPSHQKCSVSPTTHGEPLHAGSNRQAIHTSFTISSWKGDRLGGDFS
jgi:hypothetical protein